MKTPPFVLQVRPSALGMFYLLLRFYAEPEAYYVVYKNPDCERVNALLDALCKRLADLREETADIKY